MAQPVKIDFQPIDFQEEESPFEKGFRTISSPLTTLPSQIVRPFADWLTTPSLSTSPTGQGGLRDFLATRFAELKGFGAGSLQAIGDLLSEATSPVNLALAATTAGHGMALKRGLPEIANLLKWGTRAVAAPVVAHGAATTFSPETTIGQKGMGLMEIAGGLTAASIPGAKKPKIVPAEPVSAVEPAQYRLPFVEELPGGQLGLPFEGPPVDLIKSLTAEEIESALKSGEINPVQAVKQLEELYAKTPKMAAPTPPIPETKPTPTPTPTPESTPKPIPESTPEPTPKPIPELIPESTPKPTPTEPKIPPDRRIKIIRGKQGPVDVAFPDSTHKLLFEYATKQHKAMTGELTTPFPAADVRQILARRLNVPEEKIPAIANAYRRQVIDSVKGLEEESLFEALKAEIPPVEPLKQLPTPPGLGQIIKEIPETADAEFNSMVKSLRAMRRRKGIDEFNDLEKAAYNELMEKIKKHPALPEELRNRWNTIESMPTTPVPEGEFHVLPKENATPDFINKLKSQGYEFAGITNEGDYRFRKILQQLKSERGELIIGKAPETVTLPGKSVTLQETKKLFDEGFRFHSQDAEGNLIFQKVGKSGQAPVLETEVGQKRPTKKATNRELGQIQDAQKSSIIAELLNLPRGIMASWDLSAPLRQGITLIHKKEFWKALKPMLESWASEDAFRASQEAIAQRALFRKRVGPDGKILPSFAEDAGLKLTDLTDLSKREEAIMSTWAERVPGIRRSNRAYTAFLNNLRADTFESLVKDANVLGIDSKANMPLARALADFVNTATGRGSLGKLERHAVLLNSTLFAPRLIASRLKLLNPMYYVMAPPQVRKEALKSLFALAAVGNTVTQLGELAGGEVETDPASSDFGKLKLGNVRIDPYGGFQQYIVAANRLLRPSFAEIPNIQTETGVVPLDLTTGFLAGGGWRSKSSISGREYDLLNPRRPFDPTIGSTMSSFARGKINPPLGFAWSLASGGREMTGKPLQMETLNPFENSILQRFIPIVVQDIYEIAKEDPRLLPLAAPASILGMGIQAYD